MITVFLISVLSMALTGCAYVKSQVTCFHDLPAAGSGQTFVVVPSGKNDESSLEFASYARLISDELARSNFKPCGCTASNADLVVFVSYGINLGETAHHFGMVGGYPMSGTSYTDSMRVLLVDIADGTDLRKGKITKRYEGRVISRGRSSNLSLVLPVMIRALFEDFPGRSGETRTVILSP